MRRSSLFSRAECFESWLCSTARNDWREQSLADGRGNLAWNSFIPCSARFLSRVITLSRNCATGPSPEVVMCCSLQVHSLIEIIAVPRTLIRHSVGGKTLGVVWSR